MATRAVRTPLILLVSHFLDERDLYARSLRGSGYRVVGAATTALAYEIATTRSTDMVVTEAHSPGAMGGLELTRRLRSHRRTMNVPIIVLTSVMRRHDAEVSIRAGAEMFLEKPVSPEALGEHVARLLVACGRLSGQSSDHDASRLAPKPAKSRSASSSRSRTILAAPVRESSAADVSRSAWDSPLASQRSCPACRGILQYQQNVPILSVRDSNARQPQQRLRYTSGWFCSNAACEYRELVERIE